jgi:hypothetical protein
MGEQDQQQLDYRIAAIIDVVGAIVEIAAEVVGNLSERNVSEVKEDDKANWK